MQTYKSILIGVISIGTTFSVLAQGNFLNLNFESANVSGYAPSSDNVPTTSALPGWTASSLQPGVGGGQYSTVWYDAISLGGAFISVNDANTGFGFAPLQGKYSAVLFGGASTSVTISQTGLVPTGTLSLQALMQWSGAAPVVMVGVQTINMVPLQTFGNYTLYGGNISAFAGQDETLSFTEPPPASNPPSELILDDIVFSTNAVPEPATWALLMCGAGLFGVTRQFRKP